MGWPAVRPPRRCSYPRGSTWRFTSRRQGWPRRRASCRPNAGERRADGEGLRYNLSARLIETGRQFIQGGRSLRPISSDTDPEAERILIEGYRRMPAWEKLQRVGELNELVQRLAMADIQR